VTGERQEHPNPEVPERARRRTFTAAYRQHPERFVSKPPAPPALPTGAAINPPAEKEAATH
jgi:putative transposase